MIHLCKEERKHAVNSSKRSQLLLIGVPLKKHAVKEDLECNKQAGTNIKEVGSR